MGFRASHTFVKGGYDYIGGVHSAESRCYVGTCSSARVNTTRKRETASAKASAKATTNYQSYGGSSSRDVWLKLWVGKNKVTISQN